MEEITRGVNDIREKLVGTSQYISETYPVSQSYIYQTPLVHDSPASRIQSSIEDLVPQTTHDSSYVRIEVYVISEVYLPNLTSVAERSVYRKQSTVVIAVRKFIFKCSLLTAVFKPSTLDPQTNPALVFLYNKVVQHYEQFSLKFFVMSNVLYHTNSL